mgnify:CR=1 FL=1
MIISLPRQPLPDIHSHTAREDREPPLDNEVSLPQLLPVLIAQGSDAVTTASPREYTWAVYGYDSSPTTTLGCDQLLGIAHKVKSYSYNMISITVCQPLASTHVAAGPIGDLDPHTCYPVYKPAHDPYRLLSPGLPQCKIRLPTL